MSLHFCAMVSSSGIILFCKKNSISCSSQGVLIAARAIMTPAHLVWFIMLTASSTVLMLPLPMTGMRLTAATVCAIPSRRISPLKRMEVVLPWIVMSEIPIFSSCRASLGAVIWVWSQPSLSFAVTGMETAFTICSASLVVRSGLQRSIDPPLVLVTLSTGQPMLMSIIFAPWFCPHCAASMSQSGSLP